MEEVISKARLFCLNSQHYNFGSTKELFKGLWGSRFDIETITTTSIQTERRGQCIYSICVIEKNDLSGFPEPQFFSVCHFIKENLPIGSAFISVGKFRGINEGFIIKLAVLGCSGHPDFCLDKTQLNVFEPRQITDFMFSFDAFGDPTIMNILKCILIDMKAVDSGSDYNVVIFTNLFFENIDFDRISIVIESKSSFEEIENKISKEFDRLNVNNKLGAAKE